MVVKGGLERPHVFVSGDGEEALLGQRHRASEPVHRVLSPGEVGHPPELGRRPPERTFDDIGGGKAFDERLR